MHLDLLDLTHGLGTKHAVEFAVVERHLGERTDVALVDQLADMGRIVHGFVLQRRQAVVEHAIRHMQFGVFKFYAVQFIVSQFEIIELHALTTMAFVQAVTVVEHVVGRHDEQQDDNEQDDGDALVGLRLLHNATIVRQRIISRKFLEQLRIHLIIICIELPLVEGKRRNGTLVANVEDDLVIDVDTVVKPLYLSRQGRGVAIGQH